jgi:hypothetical protein
MFGDQAGTVADLAMPNGYGATGASGAGLSVAPSDLANPAGVPITPSGAPAGQSGLSIPWLSFVGLLVAIRVLWEISERRR